MAKQKIFLTCDGNQAASHIAYMFSETASIYPITPSSTMAEYVDEWAAAGRKNIFGETVRVDEMQSEAGAAGAMHGALQAGALSTTFTASQGLLLMIPNMYKVAGELLPGVYHVSARAIASHALSIFGDHQDVMAVRQTGCAMFATGSVQEVMDLAAVAHLAAIQSRVPFVHFFDGFRTSHEVQKIEALRNEDLAPLIDWKALAAFRQRALNPENPVTRGTAQNPDIYFQAREASNVYYNKVVDIVEDYVNQLSELTGRSYHLFDYYGAPDAERIIIAMGSVTEAIRETIDYLMSKGEKVGLVAVHLFRPFSAKHLLNAIPETVKRIAVLDRTKEPGASGEPLYMDIVEAFAQNSNSSPIIVGGRYGLSSKDTTPAQILAVYENLSLPSPKSGFTIGIVDDVTFTSLPQKEELAFDGGPYEAKFYGLGADGTVGANKNSIKIIGDNTDKYCQAYFAYDSKKSGGFTCSHLRFGDKPIRSTYLVNTPDFVACHVQAYLRLYDVTKGLKKNGTFLLNTIWDENQVKEHLPDPVKKYLAKNNIHFYIINATGIAGEIGLGNRTNTILQSAFFKITGVIPYDLAVEQMKKFIVKSYGKKGEDIVNKNNAAVDRGGQVIRVEVPAEWANIQIETEEPDVRVPEFIANVVRPINAQKGDDLPVSAFTGREDGTWDQGTAAFEKRGVATNVPVWIAENCIQCNQCAYVCPHAAIRPFLLDAEEKAKAPASYETLSAIPAKQFSGLQFRIQVDVLDCMGCDNCANVCPGNKNGNALQMVPIETQYDNQANWDFSIQEVKSKQQMIDVSSSVKNSQFATPLFEFSGACSGCGETPYIKLVSQLFGDRQLIANATGCTSIYSGSAPSTPYTKNEQGRGPAWANSLFEDNAEYGLGMQIATEKMRERVVEKTNALIAIEWTQQRVKDAAQAWLDHKDDGSAAGRKAVDEYVAALEWGIQSIDDTIGWLESGGEEYAEKLAEVKAKKAAGATSCDCPACTLCKELLELKHYFVKHSQWIIGGDGWAYDIGFGGLDHVIASGRNVNILVVDTEVYSNTGGQSSKSTPAGAVAKFAAAGKRVRKKDLGMIATTYGYVYVAQIAMGANQAQTLKAIREAEAYNGPSVIIAYSPCIAHGLKAGMSQAQGEQKSAVECGYWSLWRYDPRLETEGKNPFQLDSKEPDWTKFQDFLKNEVRFSTLMKQYPEEAKELFKVTQANAFWRYNGYKRLATQAY
ncbi:MAG: pyruvate:ferredoxin (flavodoxin) oxidoreductase [Candidatus Azobacteroides sp.]|nr:pyruvate:ferredoxin (flavodoxin) oxidoreductase [Candidatus Azobacteroides sp.]